MSKIQLLLVDDHEVIRMGLRTAMEDVEDLQVVGEAASAEEAVAQAQALRPDVILMDVRLGKEGDLGGIDACRSVLSDHPDTRVLMFSSYGDRETILASIVAGASGYLIKDVRRAELLDAIRATARGELLLDSATVATVVEELRDVSKGQQERGPDLTPREQEVLALVARGMTNHQIAEELVISDYTARNHVANLLDKLGFSRRSEAAAYAARLGI